ncbi:4-oxalocrotonate tautomerase family protein [Clostridium sp. P21]|uniref:4-oxalocrotonate tautomerase family protein n=1 Tax=Clostridium muellerianum TaxID=2716538 RepID=A0A7Y0EM97_9CLOT|nr:4-oxalocrotonate tautomerase DmpI [Clostridium muellerianum]NMM65991.1 4-oxalocrotonate tautomerase family protein [Clostridium muellerianum]
MPVISLEIGKLTKEQKKEIIKNITETTAEITKIPKESFTVVIHELDDENIGIGGKDIGEIKRAYNR